MVSLRVGISDSAGVVTFDPSGFCPGRPVVAEIIVENRGCTNSQPCTTEVALEDGATALATHTHLLPALAPGKSDAFAVTFQTPSSASGTSGSLTIAVRADANGANPDQCDTRFLRQRITKQFSAGQPPRAEISAGRGGVVWPGEPLAVSWSLANECADIGTADVKITCDIPATTL